MRGAILLLWFLASMTSLSSQSIKIDAKEKPLSSILNTLGLEISFDDNLLSTYKVTVSKTYPSPHEALFALLKGKPLFVEKIGNTYVLIPNKRVSHDEGDLLQDEWEAKPLFSGSVTCHSTGEPLPNATVSLLNSVNGLLMEGATDHQGHFHLSSSRQPDKIRVSYLGFETITQEIKQRSGSLGLFSMQETAYLLEEATISAAVTQHQLDRVVYHITPEMRMGITTTEELFDRIPNLRYSKMENQLTVGHHANILLLVDGMERSINYIKQISPHKIRTIEVIHSSGRMTSKEYASIVNVIQTEGSVGYDIHFSNDATIRLSNGRQQDRLTQAQPSLSMTFSDKKMTFYSNLTFNREHWHTPVNKKMIYNGIEHTADRRTTKNPNDLYFRKVRAFTAGANYKINSNHMIAFQGDYLSGNAEAEYEYANTTLNSMEDRTFIGSCYYRGKIGERLHLYSDFSYNSYFNEIENSYLQTKTLKPIDENSYDEKKRQYFFTLEGRYQLSSTFSLNTGYSNSWRRYSSTSSLGRGFLDYTEARKKGYADGSFTFSEKLKARIGLGVEQLQIKNPEVEKQLIRLLPYGYLNYRANPQLNIHIGCVTNQHYPNLYQLSPMANIVDTFVTQRGNPELLSAVNYKFFLDLTFGNKLSIIPSFQFTEKYVSEHYFQYSGKIYRSFSNTDLYLSELYLSYQENLGSRLHLSGDCSFYYGSLSRPIASRHAIKGWLMGANLSYYHPTYAMGLNMRYHRNMRKELLQQGYKMSGRDFWEIGIKKHLFREKLTLALSYTPPISWGIRTKRVKEIDTPVYKEETIVNMNSYQNLLSLTIRYRIDNDRLPLFRKKRGGTNNVRERELKTTAY